MNRAIGVAVWAALVVACGGCDGTIFRTFDLKQGQSLSIDARQRLVLVGYRDTDRKRPDGTMVQHQIVCTEPSPDALVAKAAAVAASATSPQVAAALGASMTESAASIGIRTPTIQLLRDGLFRACEAYLNEAIGKHEYQAILFNYDRIMTALLIVEAAAGFKLPPNVAINAGQVGIDTGAKSTLDIKPGTPSTDGSAPPPGGRTGTGEAGGKVTGQGAIAPAFAPNGGGYDAKEAKEVLLAVAKAMLDDPTRIAFCVTPSQADTVNVRNRYFQSICEGMTSAISDSLRLQIQMKQQCLRNPQMAVCARLNW
jgi:hypothetical protein